VLPAESKRGKLALGNQAIRGMSGKNLGMPAVFVAVTAVVLLALPSRAEEARVPIPSGCKELAERAGLPLTLSHGEAARAVAYLRIMSGHDPAVARCRLALRG